MSKPSDAIDLTVVYEDARAGRLTATTPVVPGTITTARTQTEARRNVLDALRTMLSVEPENLAEHATSERVRIVARRRTRGPASRPLSSATGRTRSSHGSIRA